MPGRVINHEKARAAALKALGEGNTRRAAAEAAHISEDTLARWIGADAAFAEDVKAAEAGSELELVKLIRRAARGGTWTAAAWLLERNPKTKNDWKRIDDLDPRKLSLDQLLTLATASERGAETTGDRLAAGSEE